MKKFLTLLIFLSMGSLVSAQRSDQMQLRVNNLYAGEALEAFDLRPRTVEGSLYLSDNWQRGAIKLKSGKVLNDHLMKFNLETNEIEIQLDEGVFVLSGQLVEEFTLEDWLGSGLLTFLSASVLPGADPEGPDFYQVVLEGEYALLMGPGVELYRPHYVPALDAGSLNTKAVRKDAYYLSDGGATREIPNGRKAAREFFSEINQAAEQFIQAEGIRFKTEEDYVRVVSFCNERL